MTAILPYFHSRFLYFCDTLSQSIQLTSPNTFSGLLYGSNPFPSRTVVTPPSFLAVALNPGPYTPNSPISVFPATNLATPLTTQSTYPAGSTLPSSNERAKIDLCSSFHGRPSAHWPRILGATEVFAARTSESTMYTPYLLGTVVFVPFHAVIPPPQPRRRSVEDWIQAVPKP